MGRATCLSPMEIERVLRGCGVQPTAQRIAIGRYVLCDADHPTAEQVKAWVDKNFPKISLATVYNTLKVFVSAGLLKELRLPDRDAIVFDSNMQPHHHFLDAKSGAVYDLPLESVQLTVALGREYCVHSATAVVIGTRGTIDSFKEPGCDS
ncbi:MAG: Fur family transcriptional regulator [Candidatus Sericytochromatia bacterium]|nr:Fur family transcriptional regulator [Candidatus Sericytochromatia bacterium]